MNRLMILFTVVVSCGFSSAKDECPQTLVYRIYSNAFFPEESGDVVGYDLALKPTNGNSYESLLYIYEGAPNLDGISLVGDRKGATISLEGDWREELVEYPSKRNITRIQHVKLKGRISERHFRGLLQLDSTSFPLSLKLANHIWLCKPQEAGQRPTTNDQ